MKKVLMMSFCAVAMMGMAACGDDKGSDEACAASCKDDNRTIVCDAEGNSSEIVCENGCDSLTKACKADAVKCEASCKDTNTAIECDKEGNAVEKMCENGCDASSKACKADAVKCEIDKYKCEGGDEYICRASGWVKQRKCPDGCDGDACKLVATPAPSSCKSNTDAFCIDEKTAWTCSDNWNFDELGADLFIHHCEENRVCSRGACVVRDDAKCISNVCKDLNTQIICENGLSKEKACEAGAVCAEGNCIASGSIKGCKNETDCDASTEKCMDGLCYRKSDLDLKIGDSCKMNGENAFQEYCKDNKRYYCYGMVETYDCADYNGCLLVVVKAFNPDKTVVAATRNASCRGTDQELANCDQGGAAFRRCYNYNSGVSKDQDFHFSNVSTCVAGLDGSMSYYIDLRLTAVRNLAMRRPAFVQNKIMPQPPRIRAE